MRRKLPCCNPADGRTGMLNSVLAKQVQLRNYPNMLNSGGLPGSGSFLIRQQGHVKAEYVKSWGLCGLNVVYVESLFCSNAYLKFP